MPKTGIDMGQVKKGAPERKARVVQGGMKDTSSIDSAWNSVNGRKSRAEDRENLTSCHK
jgi:hypothetical protein